MKVIFKFLTLLLLVLAVMSCEKYDFERVDKPVLRSESLTILNLSQAEVDGTIRGLKDEETTVEHHGVVWSSQTVMPALADARSAFNQRNGGVNGPITLLLDELTPGRKYFYRTFVVFDGLIVYETDKREAVPSFIAGSPDGAPLDLPIELTIESLEEDRDRHDQKLLTVRYTIDGLEPELSFASFGVAWSEETGFGEGGPDQFIEKRPLPADQSTFSTASTVRPDLAETLHFRALLQFRDTVLFSQPFPYALRNIWVAQRDFTGTERRGAVAFSLNGKGYLGTGLNQLTDKRLKDFVRYDPSTDTWERVASLEADSRTDAVAFVIGQRAYVGLGGAGSRKKFTDFWWYDPAADQWQQLESEFPGRARNHSVAFVIGNNAYVGLGQDENNKILKDFFRFNAQQQSWEKIDDFPGTVYKDAVSFAIGHTGYVGTGQGDQGLSSEFWSYDETNGWVKRADFGGLPRLNALGFSINGIGYITTGLGNSGELSDLWAYDPDTDSWERKLDYQGSQLSQGVSFVIDDAAYTGVGWNGSLGMTTSDIWKYIPD